jgi:hypothetical protein
MKVATWSIRRPHKHWDTNLIRRMDVRLHLCWFCVVFCKYSPCNWLITRSKSLLTVRNVQFSGSLIREGTGGGGGGGV